jgi:hypothetical protein
MVERNHRPGMGAITYFLWIGYLVNNFKRLRMMQVGTKVVCIHGFEPYRDLGYKEAFPIKGEIYTIRHARYSQSDGICLLLEEVVNAPRMFSDGFHEVTFGAKHFREIDWSFGEMITEQLEFEAQMQEKLKYFPQPL